MEPEEEIVKASEMRLDELADLHARLSACESTNIRLSRRLTALEDGGKGHYNGDELGGFFSPTVIAAMIFLSLLPILVDVWKEFRSSSSSQ